QWKQTDWKNKITTEKGWNKHAEELKNLSEEMRDYPAEFSKYGGWLGLQFDATGFFRTHHDGKRWWFVDPEGYAFLSSGMDCVRPDEPAVLTGNESLFEYLPPEDGDYKGVYGTSRELKTIDFFKLNMMRIFGREWYDAWVKITINKLVSANFNTVGNWSLERFSTKSGLPYVIPLNNFPSTKIFLYRDFPDVFSPEYREKAKVFASQLESYKNDPNLIGYFLRNEPQWAFGNNNLAFEMLASESPSYTRTALILWLKGKYQVVDSLSKSWDLELTEFEDIRSLKLKEYPSDNCRSDLWEFSKLMVSEYVDVISEETRKVDPNHLNLGMRYAYISSDLLYTAGEAFDVFSINGYSSPGPPDTDEIYRRSGKPVMIGEFHFGATDRGLPSTGLKGVKNQKERGKAYRYYLEQGFSRPEII
ncbi:MAG: beta-galactosidase, partial [Bacteroidales bacterium]|nr:beta-galactosidase [Bacteroidales bacterium]